MRTILPFVLLMVSGCFFFDHCPYVPETAMWTQPGLFEQAMDATPPQGWNTTMTPAEGIKVSDPAVPRGHDVRFSSAWRSFHHWDSHQHLYAEQMSIDANKRIEAALYGSTSQPQFVERLVSFASYFTDATSSQLRAAATEAWNRRASDTYDYWATGTTDAGPRDADLYLYRYGVAVPGNWSIEDGLRRIHQERGPPDDGHSTWNEIVTGPGVVRYQLTYLAYDWSVPSWTATRADGRVSLVIDGLDRAAFGIPRREGQTESDVRQALNETFAQFGWPAPEDRAMSFTGSVC